LSGGRNVLQKRYIRLHSDGLLSWYKNSEDADSRGSIQVRGEELSINPVDKRELWVETKNRTYSFVFSDPCEAEEWLTVGQWHAQRKPLKMTEASIRNKAET